MVKGIDTRPEPQSVRLLREALSERLGRPAASRGAKGRRDYWIVSDPCFAIIQRGLGNEQRGYRSGILVDDGNIYFYNVHARTPAKMLRTNLMRRPEALVLAAEGTREMRSYHYLHYGSRKRSRLTGGRTWMDVIEVIEDDDWLAFEHRLRNDGESIVRDLFPELPSMGRRGTGTAVRGSDFSLLLAESWVLDRVPSEAIGFERATIIIDAAWNLFACFYPWEPAQQRDADLRRSLVAAIGKGTCEYHHIAKAPRSTCDGTSVQAAHIIPYARGGSDRPWNGLWLCSKHHLATEGKLTGSRDHRDLQRILVRFVS
jgi:hypothetical protein